MTAEDAYHESRARKHIITFCRGLDALLGGGIRLGEMVEFCGVPGVGKTQLAMQLCVDVQIPEAFQGAGGEAVYIDTEGSFMVERVQQIAEAVGVHLQRICRRSAPHSERSVALAELGVPTQGKGGAAAFLPGIHVMRAHDHVEQLAAVAALPDILRQHPRVKLVVLDSVAFHFRHGASSTDFGKRTRLLASMAQKLNEIAHKNGVAVVLMNQMTTKVEPRSTGLHGSSRLVPALGESWAHAAAHRLQLFWAPRRVAAHPHQGPQGRDQGAQEDYAPLRAGLAAPTGGSGGVAGFYGSGGPGRFAKLIKSSSKADGCAPYDVTEQGVRDPKGLQHGGASRDRQQQPHAALALHAPLFQDTGGYAPPGSSKRPRPDWGS